MMGLRDELAEVTGDVDAVLAVLDRHRITLAELRRDVFAIRCLACGHPSYILAHAQKFRGGHEFVPSNAWALVELGEL